MLYYTVYQEVALRYPNTNNNYNFKRTLSDSSVPHHDVFVSERHVKAQYYMK